VTPLSWIAGAAVFAACASTSAPVQSVQEPVQDSLYAFVGVHVVSMATPEIARNQTVVVRNGVVATVGPAGQTPVPAGARRIEAGGRYLMPGLADFHVHPAERNDLALYVSWGVTTIANMGGFGGASRLWRDSIRAGQLFGPEIYVGFFLNGPANLGGPQTVPTVEEARAAVSRAAELRYDFLKVYNSLTEEQYELIMSEAKARGLPVLGHAVRSIGLERGIAMGQVAVAHAEEYIYAELRTRRDSASLASAVAFTKRHDATLIPNLSAFDVITRQWGKPAVLDTFFSLPEAGQLTEYWRAQWRSRDYVTRQGTIDALPFLKQLALAMQRGGVRILLGTDSPSIPGMFAGASIHEELRLLVEAGLTPYEALAAGTRAAGEFAERHFKAPPAGIVAPDYRADLLLLAANPLENVRNARQPLGVMARSYWLPLEGRR
jgi:imidazolonepropionase-like amidohydrolase